MKKWLPDKKALIAGALILGLAVPVTAHAAVAYNTKVKSHGVLVVQDSAAAQKIELYAEDIHYLQNELDALTAELYALTGVAP